MLAPFNEPLIRVDNQAEIARHQRQGGVSGFRKIVTPLKGVDFGVELARYG